MKVNPTGGKELPVCKDEVLALEKMETSVMHTYVIPCQYN